MLGSIELQLLGRDLGVTVHCVSACRNLSNGHALRQNQGSVAAVWAHVLYGNPRGAILVPFMGEYNCGNYQIV